MHFRKIVFATAAAMSLSACASLSDGSDQSIEVKLEPSNASCLVMKDGVPVASISEADNTLTTRGSKHDLVFDCQAPGYEHAAVRVASSAPGWGALRCFVIDLCRTSYQSGALNTYPSTVTITLQKKSFQGDKAQRN